MEDEARPEWEDLDTNQVIKEIQQKDVLSNVPQDKRTIFGNKYPGKEDLKSRFEDARFQDQGLDQNLGQNFGPNMGQQPNPGNNNQAMLY